MTTLFLASLVLTLLAGNAFADGNGGPNTGSGVKVTGNGGRVNQGGERRNSLPEIINGSFKERDGDNDAQGFRPNVAGNGGLSTRQKSDANNRPNLPEAELPGLQDSRGTYGSPGGNPRDNTWSPVERPGGFVGSDLLGGAFNPDAERNPSNTPRSPEVNDGSSGTTPNTSGSGPIGRQPGGPGESDTLGGPTNPNEETRLPLPREPETPPPEGTLPGSPEAAPRPEVSSPGAGGPPGRPRLPGTRGLPGEQPRRPRGPWNTNPRGGNFPPIRPPSPTGSPSPTRPNSATRRPTGPRGGSGSVSYRIIILLRRLQRQRQPRLRAGSRAGARGGAAVGALARWRARARLRARERAAALARFRKRLRARFRAGLNLNVGFGVGLNAGVGGAAEIEGRAGAAGGAAGGARAAASTVGGSRAGADFDAFGEDWGSLEDI